MFSYIFNIHISVNCHTFILYSTMRQQAYYLQCSGLCDNQNDGESNNNNEEDMDIDDVEAENEISLWVTMSIGQYVADNIDINIRSLYGNTSFHAMGHMRITFGDSLKPEEIEELIIPKRKISATEKTSILNDAEIKLLTCFPNKRDALATVKYKPFSELQHKLSYASSCPADMARLAGWLIKTELNHDFQHCNWKGHMKSIHRDHGMKKSNIEYLPVIDDTPDNYSTVYNTGRVSQAFQI